MATADDLALDSQRQELQRAYRDLVESRADYERAVAMYEGSVAEFYSSPKVSRLLAKFGLNNIENFNFAHIPVDTVADKLFINSITVDDRSDKENNVDKGKATSSLDTFIEDLWEYNELSEEVPINNRNACMYGDHYAMVWPVIKETPRKEKIRSGTPIPEFPEDVAADNHLDLSDVDREIVAVDIVFHDPLTTRLFYDAENPRKKIYAIRSWTEGEGGDLITRANMYYPDRIERWVYKGKAPKISRKNSSSKWSLYVADGGEGILVNPFGEVPFFHFRTDRTYGKPLHINAYGPQLAINKLVTSHLATVDFQSFPQRVALMDPNVDPSSVQGADFNPLAPDDDDQWPEDEDNASQLEADPAAVWQLDGVKDIKQFDAANPDNYLKPFDRYVKAMAQVTDTPMWAFDKGSSDRPPSGESLKQVNGPLVSKTQALQLSFGSTYRSMVEFALFLMDKDVDRVKVTWRPAETVTDKVGWETVNVKQLAGVPMDVALVEAGYLPEIVEKWMKLAEEKAEKEKKEQMELAEHAAKTKAENTPAKPPITE